MSKRAHPGHGGKRQRSALAKAIAEPSDIVATSGSSSSTSSKSESELVQHLLFQWSWGHLSATKVQSFAHKAFNDQKHLLEMLGISTDFINDKLRKLAGLGSWGKYSQNCHAELMNFLGKPDCPEPFYHQVPLTILKPAPGQESVQTKAFPIFLPHRWFAYYYLHQRDRFNELFLGKHQSPDDIEQFWQELSDRGDPRLRDHPMKKEPNWQRTYIPISFHGDGVPVLQVGKANTRSLDVISIMSLFCNIASSICSKLLVALGFADNLNDNSEQEIWRILLWSFHWLFKGVWPPVDHNFKKWPAGSDDEKLANTPLAGGLRCVLFLIKGDLDYFANHFHLRHYNSNEMCDFCPAHRDMSDPTMCYNNFSAAAKWMRLLFTIAQWLATYGGSAPHYIFQVAGVSHYSIEPDELHIMYLGTVQYMLGSILYLLVYKILRERPEENMNKVWAVISQFYKDNHISVQYTNLTLTSFVDTRKPHGHYPRLKGKGAETKNVVEAVHHAWLTLVPDTFESKAEIANMLRHQVEAQNILHDFSSDLFLPKEVACQFQEHIQNVLLTYQRLAAAADASGDLLWNQPTKFHWLYHLAERSHFLNPRKACTMLDEDYVGHIKDLTHACAAGTELHDMVTKSAEKYRWGFHFLWHR